MFTNNKQIEWRQNNNTPISIHTIPKLSEGLGLIVFSSLKFCREFIPWVSTFWWGLRDIFGEFNYFFTYVVVAHARVSALILGSGLGIILGQKINHWKGNESPLLFLNWNIAKKVYFEMGMIDKCQIKVQVKFLKLKW